MPLDAKRRDSFDQMLSQPKWKIFQSLLSGNDSECGLDPHIFNMENLGYSFNIWNWRWMSNLSFDRANVPREMAKRIWIGMDGWLAPKSFLTILKFPKFMEAEISSGFLAGAACLVIRWNRAKVFLTCSQLSRNGHKSDNKVYLLLDHCIVREVSSKKKIAMKVTICRQVKFSLFLFALDMRRWAKHANFCVFHQIFIVPHILFRLKILLIHPNDQTVCQS